MFSLTNAKEFPMRIEIEPTNECNSFCSYCPRKFMKYKKGFMKFSLYRRLIDEISSYPDRDLILFRRGEPLMNPEFPKMLEYANGKFREVQLASNASLMNRDLAVVISKYVSSISFSLELPERYKKYRRLDYETVLDNINYFLQINKKVITQVSIVKTTDISAQDIMRFKEQWLGRVDRVRIYQEHSGDGRFGSLKHSRRKRQACVKPFNDILVFWDGKVGRCNHDWGEDVLGDVNENTIKEIWHSPAYQGLRKQQIELNIKDIVCKKCDSWYEQLNVCKIGQVFERA